MAYTIKKKFLIPVVLLLFSGISYCKDIPAFRKVTLITLWRPQSQFAGYYMAYEKGIYRKYGLDVKIINGGPEDFPQDYLNKKKGK